MIISDVTEPQKSLYVIGAIILKILKKQNIKSIDPIELYSQLDNLSPKISITYFHFSLDWLYLNNSIYLDESGNIKPCN